MQSSHEAIALWHHPPLTTSHITSWAHTTCWDRKCRTKSESPLGPYPSIHKGLLLYLPLRLGQGYVVSHGIPGTPLPTNLMAGWLHTPHSHRQGLHWELLAALHYLNRCLGNGLSQMLWQALALGFQWGRQYSAKVKGGNWKKWASSVAI